MAGSRHALMKSCDWLETSAIATIKLLNPIQPVSSGIHETSILLRIIVEVEYMNQSTQNV